MPSDMPNRTFMLYTRFPKHKKIGSGVLDAGEGTAVFLSGNGEMDSHILARMERVRFEGAGTDLIRLSGMEEVGVDRNGRKKFLYQEWDLNYE